MKKVTIIALALLFSSCVHEETVEVSPEKVNKVREVAQVAMAKLRGELMKNFKKAIGQGGLVGAVSFCSERASKIEEEVNKELNGIKVTRVALKYRNPKHKPDKFDEKVLRFFEEKLKEGNLPPYYVVGVKRGGKIYYVYYKPLKVAPFCLKCHGNPENMDRRVLEVIRKKYPKDKAINFKAGDLRGACKVVIPEDKIKS